MKKESVVKLTSIELGGWVERNVPLKDFSFVAAFCGKNFHARFVVRFLCTF